MPTFYHLDIQETKQWHILFLFSNLFIIPFPIYITGKKSPTLTHIHTNTHLARIGYLIKCPLKLEMLFCSPWWLSEFYPSMVSSRSACPDLWPLSSSISWVYATKPHVTFKVTHIPKCLNALSCCHLFVWWAICFKKPLNVVAHQSAAVCFRELWCFIILICLRFLRRSAYTGCIYQ